MLVELRIRDYAVVEDLTVTLGPGLNALTGETGAGKSIIVGALSLLLGERASSTVVRTGADRATVEAVFDVSALDDLPARLDDLGIRAEDGLLILRREVAAEGRNRAWVNGSPTTAGVVGELGSALVDLHGQHEHQTLLRSTDQRAILDAFSGATAEAGAVRELHRTVRTLRADIDQREERLREIETRADFLRFQLTEIEGAELRAGEDIELEAEVGRASHAEELLAGAAGAHEALYGGDDAIADRLAEIRALIQKLARLDETLAPRAEALDEAYHAIVDEGRRLEEYGQSVEHDPRRLEAIRQRLDALFRLKRKYGPELADVLETGQKVRSELSELDDADHDLERLRADLERVWSELQSVAGSLTALRKAGAERLAEAMRASLPAVGMPRAGFDVRLRPLSEVGADGAEAVDFLVAPNVGFEPMALSRIASGGELSRVMLALKSILAGVDAVPVLVFDEIDAGIGGVVASQVAAKLAAVGTAHQVFVVTHLPQIASRARGHLIVEKGMAKGRTTTSVRSLDGDERVEEIARMLGGDPGSATSREHARELLLVGAGDRAARS